MVRADGLEVALVLIAGQEYSQCTEIEAGDWLYALTFTADGEYLVSGTMNGVQVWRVKDGKGVATMPMEHVYCVAVSKDGRFIAAGSKGDVFVWDATNYEQVFVGGVDRTTIFDVDFSPDSTRLVSADGGHDVATVWDIGKGQKVRQLDHGRWVQAAKYSPQGDRIATATVGSVRVWNNDDGQLLVDIRMELTPWHGLLWFSIDTNYLFVECDGKIRQIDGFTGSTVSSVAMENSRGRSSCLSELR